MPHTSTALKGASEQPSPSDLNVAEEENWMYDAHFDKYSVRVVVDSFALNSFIAVKTAQKWVFESEDTEDIEVELGGKNTKPVVGKMNGALNIKRPISRESVFLLEIDHEEDQPLLILELSWIRYQNP